MVNDKEDDEDEDEDEGEGAQQASIPWSLLFRNCFMNRELRGLMWN